MQVLLGFGLSLGVSGWALSRGSLTRSGAIAATCVGAAIFAGGGPAWFGVLLAFFFTSTLLAKVGKARKASIKAAFEKGDRRDSYQVLSNGGVAALCALGMALSPHAAWAGAFLGALGTANADTWATELGVLSRSQPYSVVTFKPVPRGTSGAVSVEGLLATAAGALLVGLLASLQPAAFGLARAYAVAIAGAAGVGGSLVDSLLGASLQRQYHCDACGTGSESARHLCGREARPVRGVAGFNNDVVNLLATAAGALIAALASLAASAAV